MTDKPYDAAGVAALDLIADALDALPYLPPVKLRGTAATINRACDLLGTPYLKLTDAELDQLMVAARKRAKQKILTGICR